MYRIRCNQCAALTLHKGTFAHFKHTQERVGERNGVKQVFDKGADDDKLFSGSEMVSLAASPSPNGKEGTQFHSVASVKAFGLCGIHHIVINMEG